MREALWLAIDALAELRDHTPRSVRASRITVIATLVVLGGVAGTWAYWTTSGGGTASASIGTLNAPPQPQVESPEGSATVEVDWAPGSTLGDGVTPAEGYYVIRDNGSTESPACGTSPTSPTASTSCTDTAVPDGTYTYVVVAVWHSFSATGEASEPVEVAIGGGALANPTWNTSKAQAGATGAAYTYTFKTDTAAKITSVTMTVPSGTAGSPAVGTVSGLGAGSVSLSENTLTYTISSPAWVNSNTAVSIQLTGITNTPNASSYTSLITTHGTAGGPPSVPLDNGITAAVAFTGGALENPIWTTSKSKAGETGAAYTYTFKTATAASLTSVTMTVPPGTAGTAAAGTVSGVPGGGSVSLSNDTLTYTFSATEVASGTAVSIQITGITNTPNVSSYTSQITTKSATVPIDTGTTAAVAFTGGSLVNPIWTTSKSKAGETGAAYTYTFKTATAAEIKSVTMTVPPGTAGTPAVGTVSGLGAGSISLSESTLTYTVSSPAWVNANTSISIQITGITNTSSPGSYTSQMTTRGTTVSGPTVPLDSGSSAPVAFTGGTLSNAAWTTSNAKTSATGVAYAFSFKTASTASLTSVTMTVPPGTAGTPAVGTVSGVPGGGSVSLSENTLTYTFSATEVASGTAVSIQITGLTNTSTAGSYTSQITTKSATVPIDTGTTAAVSFTAGSLANPIWATSKSNTGATSSAYTFSFKTATAASLSSVTMTVPPGTAGTPAVGTVSGLGAGSISLSENTLTYTVSSPAWVNANTSVSIQITGITNTATPGGYASQITTHGTPGGPPNVPLDSAYTAPVAFTAGSLASPIWTASKSNTGATSSAYTFSFKTATAASLSSVTMTVPSGTAGSAAVGTVSGVPGGGSVSLSENTLTYTFSATEVASGTAVSIQITGLTNTSTAGSYTSQVATRGPTGTPVESAFPAPVAFTGGTLGSPAWATSKSGVGASGAAYTFSFKTTTAGEIKSVTMLVPPGTAGSPAVGTVSKLGAGSVSLSNNTLTYTVSSPAWVNKNTSISIQITGITNTPTPGSYASQIATHGTAVSGPTIPLDSAFTSAIPFS